MSIQESAQRRRLQCSLPVWTHSCYFLNGRPSFDLCIEAQRCFWVVVFLWRNIYLFLIYFFLFRKLLKLYLPFITKAGKMLSSSISSYTSLTSSLKKQKNPLLVAILFRTLFGNSLPLVISLSPERKRVNPPIWNGCDKISVLSLWEAQR